MVLFSWGQRFKFVQFHHLHHSSSPFPALKHEYFQQGIPRIFCVNFEPEIINYIKFFLAINNL